MSHACGEVLCDNVLVSTGRAQHDERNEPAEGVEDTTQYFGQVITPFE